MEVRAYVARFGNGVQEVFVHDVHFQTAQTDAHGKVRKRGDQFGKRSPDIQTVTGNVDAGQNDLISVLGILDALFANALNRAGTASAAQIRDDAVSAKVVATVFDLHVSASAEVGADGHGLIFLRDLGDMHARNHLQNVFLPGGAGNVFDAFDGKLLGVLFRRATDHVDIRFGVDPLHLADKLARLTLRLFGDGASVDNVVIGKDQFVRNLVPEGFQTGHQAVAFALIDFASYVNYRCFHFSPSHPPKAQARRYTQFPPARSSCRASRLWRPFGAQTKLPLPQTRLRCRR